jgi:hypothetical protein
MSTTITPADTSKDDWLAAVAAEFDRAQTASFERDQLAAFIHRMKDYAASCAKEQIELDENVILAMLDTAPAVAMEEIIADAKREATIEAAKTVRAEIRPVRPGQELTRSVSECDIIVNASLGKAAHAVAAAVMSAEQAMAIS